MPIRDLILTNNDSDQAFRELQMQWTEMAGVVNELLNSVEVSSSGNLYPNKNVVFGSTTYAVVLKSAGGLYWRISVGGAGTLSTINLGSTPP